MYARTYRRAAADDALDLFLQLRADPGLDRRRYNLPTTDSEVALIMHGDGEEGGEAGRNVSVRLTGGGLQRISDMHPSFLPLSYPLSALTCRGELGWQMGIPKRQRPAGPDGTGGGGGSDCEGGERRADGRRKQAQVTPMDYGAFYLHQRGRGRPPPGGAPEDGDDLDAFHRQARLKQQMIVEFYALIESHRLQFIRGHQKELRCDTYAGLHDHISAGDANAADLGARTILPATFIGGARHMHQLCNDAIAIAAKFGKPDLFVTITCNPKWPEITREVPPGQDVADYPELTARVFAMKLAAIKKDIFTGGIFGRVVAHVHTIEFQKRGLLHAHLLIILAETDKMRTVDDIDAFVSAELPDPTAEPELFETVSKNMMHGPCGARNPGAPCMVDGPSGPNGRPIRVCSKHYQRDICGTTTMQKDGYPVYRRRDDGRFVTKTVKRQGQPDAVHRLDNRDVVPHNPYLSKKYNCHINVEVCTSIKAIKYVYKYIFKGHDRVRATVEHAQPPMAGGAAAAAAAGQPHPRSLDEIKDFVDGRYVGSCDACWRILGKEMHAEWPPVVRLAVHLPDQQPVLFDANAGPAQLAAAVEASRKTTLTQWMVLNAVDPAARTHLYREMPEHYTWDRSKKEWRARRAARIAIGRVYAAHPADSERYHLRLLLHHVKGATSFEDIRTVNGVLALTFKEAAYRRGLLQEDGEWDAALTEATAMRMPAQIRELFANLLIYCDPRDPYALWEKHKEAMCEDLLHRFRVDSGNMELELPVHVQHAALREVHALLEDAGTSLQAKGFPPHAIPPAGAPGRVPRVVAEEMCYDAASEAARAARDLPCLNADQRRIYDAVQHAMASVEAGGAGKLIFVDGPGGTGKTFLYSVMLASVRGRAPGGRIALAVASSGIAALLLTGGRTAHSRFKIPIKVHETAMCRLPKQSHDADLLRRAELIVWDEAPMSHKHAVLAVDRALQDITGCQLPFGGKVVVMGGDFRQVLPVVPRGTPEQIMNSCIKRSALWAHVQVMPLTINMRVQQVQGPAAPDAERRRAFAAWLLRIGEGTEVTHPAAGGPHTIRVPDDMSAPTEEPDHLLDAVFGNNPADLLRKEFVIGRAILTPKNTDVDAINERAMARFPTLTPDRCRTFSSADEIDPASDAGGHMSRLYPTEYLNSLNVSGLPPHKLTLKIGAPAMLLRNMNGARGQANGTRVIIRGFADHVIDVELATGPRAGTRVLLPRIGLSPSEDVGLPFILWRPQFSLRPAFAMTINNLQGQTLDRVGIYLPESVFSHGQLYVALSRVGSPDRATVMVKGGRRDGFEGVYTDNIVYKEILI
jgi:hypothetical protein